MYCAALYNFLQLSTCGLDVLSDKMETTFIWLHNNLTWCIWTHQSRKNDFPTRERRRSDELLDELFRAILAYRLLYLKFLGECCCAVTLRKLFEDYKTPPNFEQILTAFSSSGWTCPLTTKWDRRDLSPSQREALRSWYKAPRPCEWCSEKECIIYAGTHAHTRLPPGHYPKPHNPQGQTHICTQEKLKKNRILFN